MSGRFLGLVIYLIMISEQVLDTGVHIVRSRVYPDHFHDPVLESTVHNFRARYGGLCTIMYVYACYSTN